MGDLSDLNFNAENVEPARSREPVPAGDYMVMVIDANVKPNRAETGKLLKVQFEIMDGQYAGRWLWTNINTANPSAQCVEIGHAELSALCRAVGVAELTDTTQLIGKTLLLGVQVDPEGYNGKPTNDVVGYQAAGPGGNGLGKVSKPATPRPNTVPAQATDRVPPPVDDGSDLPF